MVDGREREVMRSRLRAEEDCREEGTTDDERALGERASCTRRAWPEDGRALAGEGEAGRRILLKASKAGCRAAVMADSCHRLRVGEEEEERGHDEEEEVQFRIPRASRAGGRVREAATGEAARVGSCLRPMAWTGAWRILLLLRTASTGSWACVWEPGATGGIRLLKAWKDAEARACTRVSMGAGHIRLLLRRGVHLLPTVSRDRMVCILPKVWKAQKVCNLHPMACGAARSFLHLRVSTDRLVYIRLPKSSRA